MKVIIERRKSHEGIIGKERSELFDTEFERNIALQAINEIIDEVEAYHATNDTEIDAIVSEYIDDIEALKPGDYSFSVGDFDYYVEIKAEGGNEMQAIIDELRNRYNIDGENERYATYFASKSDVLEQYDADVFEDQFDVTLNDVSFPIITFDESGHDGGYLFESDADRNDILYEAERYFEKKD